jgi:hypothetical protein
VVRLRAGRCDPGARAGTDFLEASTLRLGDLDGDGKADVCGRSAAGIVCARSLGRGFERARAWLAGMTDADGWREARYAASIALADVNGDGKADLCGRGKDGVVCALSTGTAFERRLRAWSAGTDFSDGGATPWGEREAYYATIRFGDVNGDGRADVCGRGRDGLACALSTGAGFAHASVWLGGASDSAGAWGVERARTLALGDVNGDGRADVCTRGEEGVECALAP